MAPWRTVPHSSSLRGAFSSFPFLVIVVETEFQIVSAAGSTMPSIKSLMVVVGRYSASGFGFAQLRKNTRSTKAESNSNRRTESANRDRRADRIRLIGRRKVFRSYPQAH